MKHFTLVVNGSCFNVVIVVPPPAGTMVKVHVFYKEPEGEGAVMRCKGHSYPEPIPCTLRLVYRMPVTA